MEKDLGGEVQRPCEVVSIRDLGTYAEIEYRSGDTKHSSQAKWIVGCDGAHSIVREQASISFTGDTYEEGFILADVEMDWPLDRDEVSLFFSVSGQESTFFDFVGAHDFMSPGFTSGERHVDMGTESNEGRDVADALAGF